MKHLHLADAAGHSVRTNSEGPTVGAVAPQECKNDRHSDFQAPDLSGQDFAAVDKTFATLRARLAIGGFALSRSDAADGPPTYYLTRRGALRELKNMAAVETFARLVGAVK